MGVKKMKKLSIVVPSIKPVCAMKCIHGINLSARLCPYEYEIIIVSPFDIYGDHVIWAYQPQQDCDGSVKATNIGAKKSCGDYVLCFTDDWTLTGDWWSAISFMEERLQSRQFKILSISSGAYNGIPYGNAYWVRRDTLDGPLKGHLFNPPYYQWFGDIDLSMKLYDSNEPIVSYDKNCIIYYPDSMCEGSTKSKRGAEISDITVFNALWGKYYTHVIPDEWGYSGDMMTPLIRQRLSMSIW